MPLLTLPSSLTEKNKDGSDDGCRYRTLTLTMSPSCWNSEPQHHQVRSWGRKNKSSLEFIVIVLRKR